MEEGGGGRSPHSTVGGSRVAPEPHIACNAVVLRRCKCFSCTVGGHGRSYHMAREACHRFFLVPSCFVILWESCSHNMMKIRKGRESTTYAATPASVPRQTSMTRMTLGAFCIKISFL